jgi:periplasmic copper chaperone A
MRFGNTVLAGCLVALLLVGCQADGQTAATEQRTGQAAVQVTQAWARATPEAAPVAGAFMTIVNESDQADRLLAVESAIAEQVEIHEMRHEDGMMKMREMENGVPVPAHGTLELKPGGYHLMLVRPVKPLQEGDQFSATLVFEHAGRQEAHFDVRALGAAH